jgi:c-di-GMP-binding flagellar brake protein YcgR
MAGKQRRHFFRVDTDLGASCRLVEGLLAGPSFAVRALDLSAGGAWLEVPERLPRGQLLRFELEVVTPPLSLRARARVVRDVAEGESIYAGVQFEGLDKRTKADITRFVFAEARRTGQGAAYVQPGEPVGSVG